MDNVPVRNTCYDMRYVYIYKVAATYLSLAHISCACATSKKKTSTSFDLQKASLSYDCSDISAICVEEVLLQAKLFDAGLPGLSDVGLWKGANHLHDN
jgi:hypothetical protein